LTRKLKEQTGGNEIKSFIDLILSFPIEKIVPPIQDNTYSIIIMLPRKVFSCLCLIHIVSCFVSINKMKRISLSLADREPTAFAENDFTDPSNLAFIIGGRNSTVLPPAAPEVNKWTNIMKLGFPDNIGCDLTLNEDDEVQVENYWRRLMPMVSYLGTEQVRKVFDALRVAYRAHRGQLRKSGEPFVVHPVEVALLLTELKMDGETVIAGLLHDTVEDTDLTLDQIEGMFGTVVKSIVEGETKVSKLPKLAFEEYADEQAENLRQMFIAMTDDYRIIIVKLADRLHNMRTLSFMKPEKQIKISRETLDIFAPLAHRMGIWQFKSELEDISFMYLYPQEYRRLKKRLELHQKKYQETLDVSQDILRKTLSSDKTLREQTANLQVCGRTKEIYSLWYKMETKEEHNLDHIADVVALRVIITPHEGDEGVWLCYHVLGLVQHLPGFQPVPTRVKDYISFPKPNGYQSLHTNLMLKGQLIEVQIRTQAMHQVAEYGMASHWAYKEGKRRGSQFTTPWLSSIKEWGVMNSREFVDSVRNELLGKRVFVFLRNGKILNLPRGTTAIDAAFQIHTEVGLKMHGVEVNGKSVPFSYVLKNGDVVSVLSGHGKPQIEWMQHAKSRSTRSKLRAFFREKQKESLREAGKLLIMDYLWMHGPLIEKSSYLAIEVKIPTTIHELDAYLPGKTRYTDVNEMLLDIGKNPDRAFLHQTISKLFLVPQSILIDEERSRRSSPLPSSLSAAVHNSIEKAKHAAIAAEDENSCVDETVITPDVLLQLDGDLSQETEFADSEYLCNHCLPIWGDDILGTRPLTDENAATVVHRVACPHAQRALHDERSRRQSPLGNTSRDAAIGDQVVSLMWSDFSNSMDKAQYLAEIVLVCEDRKLLLADCSEIVSELSCICKTGSVTTNEHATLNFLIKVNSLQHLQEVMNRLSRVRSVMSVERRVSFHRYHNYRLDLSNVFLFSKFGSHLL
jgi:RelA/SpoT family (p)ppGpp synthetase